MANTLHGQEVSELIVFKKGLPQRDALCLRLFKICLLPVTWKISASKGYKLSKPISARVTHLLYIDDRVTTLEEGGNTGGSTALLCLRREKGGRGLRLLEKSKK